MTEKTKKKDYRLIVIIVLVVIFAVFALPEIAITIEANSAATKEQAQSLIAGYDGQDGSTISLKSVCRDLILLKKQHITPDQISNVEGDVVVYEVNVPLEDGGEWTTLFDVKKSWNNMVYYHTVDDGGEATIRLNPWGTVTIY